MGNEEILEFDEFLIQKDKRRLLRERKKIDYEDRKIHKTKGKHRDVKIIDYDPSLNYEEYEDEYFDLN